MKQKAISESFFQLCAYLDADFGQEYSSDQFARLSVLKNSPSRIFALCCSVPIVIFLSVTINLLPLQPPELGVYQNYLAQIIGDIYALYTGIMISGRLQIMIADTTCTARQRIICISIFVFTVAVLQLLGGMFVGYPIPFTAITCGLWGMLAFYLSWYFFEAPRNRPKMIVPLYTLGLTYTTLMAHELIGVLYTSQKDNDMAQSAIALLLPVVKYIFRFLQVWLLKDFKEGLATSIITFEVEFFNSLYGSVFLQTTTSPLTIGALMMVDFVENMCFVYRLNGEAGKLKKTRSSSQQKMLRLLFKTEMVVLIEFVEVVTPIIYGCWLLALYHSPNLMYYKSLRETTLAEFHESLWNVAFYALIEALSLAILIIVLRWNHGLPLLEQLGGAIDRYRWVIYPSMAIWTSMGVCAQLEHTGNDYTFQFNFLNN